MVGPIVWRNGERMRIAPGFSWMALLGVPFTLGGGLAVGALLWQVAHALMTGAYVTTPGLLRSHVFGALFSPVFLCLGLLMLFGGLYVTIDRAAGALRVRHFYGFFTYSRTYDLAGVVQVVQRIDSDYEVGKRRRQFEQRRPTQKGYAKLYRIELELQGGQRVALVAGGTAERTRAAAAQVAELLGVPHIDLGLVGSVYRQTGAAG